MEATTVVEAYRDYIGIKLHFNDNKFTYRQGGMQKVTADSVLKRKDINQIIRFAEKYSDNQKRLEYLVSMFLHDPKIWIGKTLDLEMEIVHAKRMATVMSLDYNVKTDVDKIVEYMEDNELSLKDMLLTNGDRPTIIRASDLNTIKIETLSILQKYVDFCSQESINPFWTSRSLTIRKYSNFITINSNIEDQIKRMI